MKDRLENQRIYLRKGDYLSVHKNEFPILEYDDEKDGVILPNREGGILLPEMCVITFLREVLEEFIEKNKSSHPFVLT